MIEKRAWKIGLFIYGSLLSFCHFVILFIHLNEFLNDESNTSCDYKTLTGTTGNWTTEVFQRVRFTWRELSFARFAPWNDCVCVCVCACCADCLCVLCVRVIVKEKILCMHVSHSNRCHCISDDIMRLMVVFLGTLGVCSIPLHLVANPLLLSISNVCLFNHFFLSFIHSLN